MADIREQLLAAFEVEQSEHVEAMRAALARARAGQPIDMREVFRRAHSLKGAARAVDAPAIEAAAHALEALFADVSASGAALDEPALDGAGRQLDVIEREVQVLFAPAPDMADARPAAEFLRVDSGHIQVLATSLYELSADLALIESSSDRLDDLQGQAQALARSAEAVAARIASAETSALAAESRALALALAAVARQQGQMAWAASQAAARVRGEMERIALAPAASVFAGLDSMVRELAASSSCDINFHVEGLDTQADRKLLQSLRDPVIHLLRNAIAHGVESAEARSAVGKPPRGEIVLRIEAKGGRLIVSVKDDGAGPDLKRIEAVAIARGLLPQRVFGQPPPTAEVLLAIVFAPEFSTSAAVDKLSGRGLGLSVVAEAARAAGGEAYMTRRAPWGTEVTISTPLSAAHQTLLFAKEGRDYFALPSHAVERVVRVAADALEDLDGRHVFRLQIAGNQIVIPVVSLSNAVGVSDGAPRERPFVHVAVVRQGEQRLGLSAESFEGVRAATVTTLDMAGAVSELVAGAVQFDDEAVAVVIDAGALMRRAARGELDVRTPQAIAPLARAAARGTVLIVDDSITTRTLEKSILEAQGYRVLVSVDGVDALNVLRTATVQVDVIIADVEMPRMDGFQLLQTLKSDPHLASVPVVLMTSRSDPSDVQRGLELGADAYLVKQDFDQRELLTTIGQLL
jgi:two-component system chemotaxis sensor kinase CheA